MKTVKLFTLNLIVFFITVTAANAASAIQTGLFGNTAISGYDPVSYVTEGKAVKGSKSHTYKWNGAKWRFSSAENRDAFAQNPEFYAPQFGGYCAWAVAKNQLVKVNPKIFVVHEGKAYLFYNNDTREKWQADVAGNIALGNQNYPTLIAE